MEAVGQDARGQRLSHEVTVVKCEHYSVAALWIKDVGEVLLHTPVEVVCTLYIKSLLLAKGVST